MWLPEDERLGAFASGNEALPLSRVPDAPFLDLASTANPSTCALMAFLPAAGNVELLARAGRMLRRTLTEENTAVVFFSHRFVEPPPPGSDADARVGFADAVWLAVPGPNRGTLVKITRAGATRRTSQSHPQTVPHRRGDPRRVCLAARHAAPRALVGLTPSGRYGSARVRFTGSEHVDADLSDAGVKGAAFRDGRLTDPGRNLLFRPQFVSGPDAPARLETTRQALDSPTRRDRFVLGDASTSCGPTRCKDVCIENGTYDRSRSRSAVSGSHRSCVPHST